MKVSQIIQEILLEYKIDTFFGIVGREASVIHFDETEGRAKFILTRHENTAGIMAGAVSYYTDNPTACFVTIGPGTTHIMTGIATATQDRRPIIFIAAQVESNLINYNNTHQCIDTVSITKPLTKYSYELIDPEDVYDVLYECVRLTKTLPYGPTFISIPIDVLNSDIEFDSKLIKKIEWNEEIIFKNSHDFNVAINILNNAKKPIIILGDGCKNISTSKEILKFAEQHNIPIMCTYSTIGLIPHDHILYYGVINSYEKSIIKLPVEKEIFKDKDVIVLIGYDSVEHHPNTWNYGEEKICISINSYRVKTEYKNVINVVDLVGDINEILKKININMDNVIYSSSTDINLIRKKRKISMLTTNENSILLGNVICEIERNIDNYILVSDVGLHRHLSTIYYTAKCKKSYITSFGLSAFGTGLALGLGVKYANLDKNVVVVAGDGGFLSSCGDLETASRLGLKILVVIINSNSYSLIKRYLQENTKKVNSEIVDLNNVNFALLSQSMGCQGFKVNNCEELAYAINMYKKFDGSTLIDVNINYPNLYASLEYEIRKLLFK